LGFFFGKKKKMLKLGVLILCSVYLINGQFTDRTRIPKQSGSDVVEAVVNLIREACMGPLLKTTPVSIDSESR
jgi:hypothetical protein